MGYISIQINKAKGSADTGASDHIERKTIPKNADPTRTHLNRELVEFPDGVSDRTEAISHRIRTAGIKRKITPDQVRAIRIVLSGTHEDMMKIQDEGRLDEWCDDNLQWLQRTFGKENTVSAVLHMDEHTPHIHATVVPIVTGERRKAKKKQTDKANPNLVNVVFESKDGNAITVDVPKQFCNELIDQQLRYNVNAQFGHIRDMIVEEAFKPVNSK